MESVEAANGLSAHLGNTEAPSLMHALIYSAQQRRIQDYALNELLPNLPPDQFDPVAWQAAVDPQVSPPSILADTMRGEWNAMSLEYLFPMLVDAEEPNYPPDPDALIDVHASYIADMTATYDQPDMADWTNLPSDLVPKTAHLSRESRQLLEQVFVATEGVGRNLRKVQVNSAMTQAAFAIMQGQPIPPDPIQGLPYQWDPATRQLSLPDSPFFNEMEQEPITVPDP